MVLDFNKIEEQILEGFKGGDKSVNVKMFFDGTNRIMKFRIFSGSSIGMHTHDTNCEVMFFTKGEGHVIYDGERMAVRAGDVHYCPKGHSHTLINDSEDVLELSAVVAQQ